MFRCVRISLSLFLSLFLMSDYLLAANPKHCEGKRFAVQYNKPVPYRVGELTSDELVIKKEKVSLASGCPRKRLKRVVVDGEKINKYKAVWKDKQCAGYKGEVKLVASWDKSCDTISGKLITERPKGRSGFKATEIMRPAKLNPLPFISAAASKVIGKEGGTLLAEVEGVSYELSIPAEALTADAEIRVVPLEYLEGLSFEMGLLGAVQLEPKGLSFLKPVTLTISTEVGEDVVPFTYVGNGKDVAATLARITESGVEIDLFHFSGAGAGAGSPSGLPTGTPVTAEQQAKGKIFAYDLLDPLIYLDDIKDTLDTWYFTSVFPNVINAARNPSLTTLRDALREAIEWNYYADKYDFIDGLGGNATGPFAGLWNPLYRLFFTAIQATLDFYNAECKRTHDFYLLGTMIEIDAMVTALSTDDEASQLVKFAEGFCVQPKIIEVDAPDELEVDETDTILVRAGWDFGDGSAPALQPPELAINFETSRFGDIDPSVAITTPYSGLVRVDVTATEFLEGIDDELKVKIHASPLPGNFNTIDFTEGPLQDVKRIKIDVVPKPEPIVPDLHVLVEVATFASNYVHLICGNAYPCSTEFTGVPACNRSTSGVQLKPMCPGNIGGCEAGTYNVGASAIAGDGTTTSATCTFTVNPGLCSGSTASCSCGGPNCTVTVN